MLPWGLGGRVDSGAMVHSVAILVLDYVAPGGVKQGHIHVAHLAVFFGLEAPPPQEGDNFVRLGRGGSPLAPANPWIAAFQSHGSMAPWFHNRKAFPSWKSFSIVESFSVAILAQAILAGSLRRFHANR